MKHFFLFLSKIREQISVFKKSYSKIPPFCRWLRISEVLSKEEKMIFVLFFVLFFLSSLFLGINFYFENTVIKPTEGGEYIEGIIGFPRFINPVLATSDVDRDLMEIIFSGLMKYNPQGEIIVDLAKDIEIKEEGKIYEVYLKENLFWHDGKNLTPDDIIFTIRTIQDPDYKSPQRANWLGVEIEKISNERGDGIRFKLSKSYAGFLERLTLKIIPKHIWQEISPENFPLSIYNLRAIGSGFYQLKEIRQDEKGRISSLILERFKKYHGKSPYISQISFRFFETEEELVLAFNRGEIGGLSPSLDLIAKEKLFGQKEFLKEYSFLWPRYFALFFNPKKAKVLEKKEIRQALNYATDKKEIADQVFFNRCKIVDSPILPEIFGFKAPSKIYQFDPEKAEVLLENSGFEKREGQLVKIVGQQFPEFKSDLRLGSQGEEVKNLQACLAQDPKIYPEGKITGYFGETTKAAVIRFQEKYASDILAPWGFKEGTGVVSKTTRKKLNEVCGKPPEIVPLKFSLRTSEDPILIEIANLIKKQWENLGISLTIETFNLSELEQVVIKPRDYEILLFGQALSAIPDPFPFWHSLQTKDPGLNLTGFESKEADKLLEEARSSLEKEVRTEKYQAFQEILIEQAPAVFLCSSEYIYLVSNKIGGMEAMKLIPDPSKRFSGIENWFIKTKRIWK